MASSDRVLFLDTETTGVKMFDKDKIFAISYATNQEEVKYIDLRENENPRPFIEELDKCDVAVAHGTKFDAHALKQIKIDLLDYNLDCTLVRAQLLDEHRFTYDLDSLTGQKMSIIDELAKMFGGMATKNVQMPNLHKAPREFVDRYAKQDIVALRSLYLDQKELKMPEVHALEKSVLKVLIKMERQGVRVNIEKAQQAIGKVDKIVKRAGDELAKITGVKGFNANSVTQMRAFFVKKEREDGKFELIDGTIADRTKADGASLNAEKLEEVDHPAARLVLQVRKYAKIRDTFLVSQIMGHHINGRIHANFNQTRVVTGRLSCNDPALQAIPKRDPEMKAILRPLFLPEDGHTLARFDYDQSDVRGFAHYILGQSPNPDEHPVLRAYKEDPDTDFHTFVSNLLDIRRNPGVGGGANAKQINLAMIFNMGGGRLAKQMKLPYFEETGPKGKIYLKAGPEAEAISYKYHSAIPGAGEMGKVAASIARSRGYVKSILGRHLRFPQKGFCYKASGYLYQSFTADLIKKAMVDTDGLAMLHMQIHDELVFSVNDENQIWAIKDAMQSTLDGICTIPVRTTPEIGQSWGETSILEDLR